jgi:hypothetical protein
MDSSVLHWGIYLRTFFALVPFTAPRSCLCSPKISLIPRDVRSLKTQTTRDSTLFPRTPLERGEAEMSPVHGPVRRLVYSCKDRLGTDTPRISIGGLPGMLAYRYVGLRIVGIHP